MKTLRINEVVMIEKEFYKVILTKWSNGKAKGKIPIIKKLKNEDFKDLVLKLK